MKGFLPRYFNAICYMEKKLKTKESPIYKDL